MLDADIAALMGEAEPVPALTPHLVPALRANMAAMAKALSGPELWRIRDLDADGVPVRLYLPSDDDRLPLLVFLHGGGWMLGDLDTHDAMHRHLAQRARCAVLAVGYRLAPEHCFPAGLDDCAAAFAWARREAAALGCDPDRIALGGESAGGNLSAALCLKLQEAGEPQPAFQLLVHPVTDLMLRGESFETIEAPGLSRDYLTGVVDFYAAGTPLDQPMLSPCFAQRYDGLAPAVILTASEDPLRDDGEAYAALLTKAGVETLAMRLQGLPHGFMFLPATLPAVDRAFDLIARLIRRYFVRG